MDDRLGDLERVCADGTGLGGIEGEPGWIIERREGGETKGYEAWPESAHFRSFVDPQGYTLGYPEFFCGKSMFQKFVDLAVKAYCDK